MYINYGKLCELARDGKVDVVNGNGRNCIDPNPVKNGSVGMDLTLTDTFIQVIFEYDKTDKKERNPVVVYYAIDAKIGTYVEKNKITFKSTNLNDVLEMLGWFNGELSLEECKELIKKLKSVTEPEIQALKVGNKFRKHKVLRYTLAQHYNKNKPEGKDKFFRIGGTDIWGFEKFKTIADVVAAIEKEYTNKVNPVDTV